MKEFFLGFFFCLSICSVSYTVWENYRHIPVLIREIPVPVPMQRLEPEPDPMFSRLTEV